MTRITGPAAHPLTRRINDGRRDARDVLSQATELYREHVKHGLSDQSVAQWDSGTWYLVGPVEDHQDMANNPDVVVINARSTPPAELALMMADSAKLGQTVVAERLRDAADAATPMVAALLASALADGVLDWDTGETVSAAARRLAYDAAWSLLLRLPLADRPARIYEAVVEMMPSLTRGRTAQQVAADFVARHGVISTGLLEAGVEMGGATLSAAEAAERAGVAGSTWRAYASRGEVPAADRDGGWSVALVDAWRLSAPRRSTAWWA